MGSVVLNGSTSGAVTLSPAAVAGSNTITLPALTGTVVVAGQSSAIIAGTSVASTSGTSIDFTSIPSWVKRITVMFSGVSTSGTSILLFQLGSGSPQTTGYVATSSNLSNGGSVAVTSSTAGVPLFQNLAAEVSYGSIVFSLVGSNSWVANGNFACTSGVVIKLANSGGVTLSGTLDRVRITTTNGTDTFDAGSINILYE